MQKKGGRVEPAEGRCPGSAATLPSGRSFAAAGRRLRAASSLGLRASWQASGAPSNHARPRDLALSAPPARLPPNTHCARPQRTHRGPEGAIPAEGKQARNLGAYGAWKGGGHRARAAQPLQRGWDSQQHSGRCSLEVKALEKSTFWHARTLYTLILPNPYGLFLWPCLNSLL